MTAPRFLAALVLTALSGGALAHEGHGLPGTSHWHAGDALPWLGLAVVAAVAWFSRRK
jgi:hypothetical protein